MSYVIVFVDMKFAETCLSTIVLKNGYESNVLKVRYTAREAPIYLLLSGLYFTSRVVRSPTGTHFVLSCTGSLFSYLSFIYIAFYLFSISLVVFFF